MVSIPTQEHYYLALSNVQQLDVTGYCMDRPIATYQAPQCLAYYFLELWRITDRCFCSDYRRLKST